MQNLKHNDISDSNKKALKGVTTFMLSMFKKIIDAFTLTRNKGHVKMNVSTIMLLTVVITPMFTNQIPTFGGTLNLDPIIPIINAPSINMLSEYDDTVDDYYIDELLDINNDMTDVDLSYDDIDQFESSYEIIEELDIDEEYEMEEIEYNISDFIGEDVIETEFGQLIKRDLPDKYYGNIDYSYFKPYESYRAITSKGAAVYEFVHGEEAYTDDNAFRRYQTDYESEFTVNTYIDEDGYLQSDDDYLVALGTFYMDDPYNWAGKRFLIVGENHMYTIRIGDTKSDAHTDKYNMFSTHGNQKQYAGLIEFIMDTQNLPLSIKQHGTVSAGPDEKISEPIMYIYSIS